MNAALLNSSLFKNVFDDSIFEDTDLDYEQQVILRLSLENNNIDKVAEYFCENDCVNDWFKCNNNFCNDDGSSCLDCWRRKVKEISEKKY